MFPAGSRYYGVDITIYTAPDGREIPYLRRRFPPAQQDGAAIVEHVVTEGERLDNITARYLGDPEQFWRICDANNAMRPEDLTEEIGLRLRIPFPQGGVI